MLLQMQVPSHVCAMSSHRQVYKRHLTTDMPLYAVGGATAAPLHAAQNANAMGCTCHVILFRRSMSAT